MERDAVVQGFDVLVRDRRVVAGGPAGSEFAVVCVLQAA